ncbi:glycosyltransferase family 2 protein [Rhodobacteraceae bacterium]|nr:glycosyltransferase family 2 protein [Paracoccaceae bacterium]
MTTDVLVVVPCLNEAANIETLLESLLQQTSGGDNLICVVDGGSTDGTIELIKARSVQDNRVRYLNNPGKIQSAAVNLAVKTYGANFTYFIRIDAHAQYPDDFLSTLVKEAQTTGADSVTVAMNTIGLSPKQQAIAVAQNSILGNGGAAHRLTGKTGRWVDHAHHALMKVELFEAVGGYDESFSHNEDAELDFRLGLAGGTIWLTGSTRIDYFPRSTFSALALQYFKFGAGRLRTLFKHRLRPKLRQLIPMVIIPSCLFAALSVYSSLAAVPALFWLVGTIGVGIVTALTAPEVKSVRSGLWVVTALLVLQLSWSLGACKTIINEAKAKVSPVLR